MLNDESFDIQKAKIEELKRLFPEVVTEGGIDFETLKATLGGDVDDAKEKYRFTWNGKSELFSLINRKTKGALKPDVKKSGGEKAFEKAENVIIEADNLEAMKLLMSAYHRRVKMIYIDPPYNKQKDFVYPDNWSDPLESYLMQTGQKDEFGLTASYQDKTGRLHTNWLNMIYPRLYLARNLLRDDGVIFVSIDDDEVHNLRKVMDEIFGEENFVGQLIVNRSEGGGLAKQLVIGHDYVLVYSKNIDKFEPLKKPKDIRGKIVEIDGRKYWIEEDWLRKEFGKYGTCPYEEIEQYKGLEKKSEIDEGLKNGIYTLLKKGDNQHIVGRYRDVEMDGSKFYSILKHLNANGIDDLAKLGLQNIFSFPKPVSLLAELIRGATFFSKDENDVILDFFAGSGTTAHAVMTQNIEDGGNRQYILVQMPEYTPEGSEARKAKLETIADITAKRVKEAIKKLNYENGFRYFRLDRSHFRVFEQMTYEKGKSKEEVLKILRMSMFHDNTLMANWTPIGVAFEIGLKNGMPLTSKYKVEKNGEYTLHTLVDNERVFVFCFDTLVKEDIAKLLPQNAKFICLDKSLTDSIKLNIVAQIGLENVETI